MFRHWMVVAASSSEATARGSTGTKALVPDPPNYKACIAHLAATADKPKRGEPRTNVGQLKSQCEQEYTSLKQQVLAFLISSDWVLGEAESKRVKVSDEEATKEFQAIKSAQFPKPAAFKHYLASSGLTIPDLMLRVNVNLLSSKIQRKAVDASRKVTDSQIRKYYGEHKSRFTNPEKRDVLIVLSRTRSLSAKARREVEAGKTFASVARRYSIIQGHNGSELKGLVDGEGEAGLDRPIFAAKVGVLTGPVKTPLGYYIFEVKHASPATPKTLKQASPAIKQQLTVAEEQKALTRYLSEFKARWTAKTECRASYVVSDCKGYKR
jgi:foldase protein PrsA